MLIPYNIIGEETDGTTIIFLGSLKGMMNEWDILNGQVIRIQETISEQCQTINFEFTPEVCLLETDILIQQIYNTISNMNNKFIIIGRSYGGFIGMLFTQKYPNIVESLMLIDSTTPQSIGLMTNNIGFAKSEEDISLYIKIKNDLLKHDRIILNSRIILTILIDLPLKKYLTKKNQNASLQKYIEKTNSLLTFYNNLSSNGINKIITTINGSHNFKGKHKLIIDNIECLINRHVSDIRTNNKIIQMIWTAIPWCIILLFAIIMTWQFFLSHV
jgi:hypothetical protein